MASKQPDAPNTDEFFTSFRELFEEAKRKGFTKRDHQRHLRTNVANYLFACSKFTAAKAGSLNPITLADGSLPEVTLAKPPAWLKIDQTQQSKLSATTNNEKFLEILEKLNKKAGPKNLVMGTKRPAGQVSERPTKVSKTIGQPTSRPAVRLKLHTVRKSHEASALADGNSADSDLAKNESELTVGLGDVSFPEEGPVKQVKAAQGDNDGSNIVSGEPRDVYEENDIFKQHECTEETGADAPAIQEASEPSTSPADGVARFDLEGAHDNEDESRLDNPVVAIFTERGEERTTKLAPCHPGPETTTMIKDLCTEIESVDSSCWEEYRPRLIDHLHHLGLGLTAPSVALDSLLAGSPTKRLEAMLASCSEELATIAPSDWEEIYKPELYRLCSSDVIHLMNFRQRLEKIGRIIYLREEEVAMASGDWDRLRSIVLGCVLLAQATGPEKEETSEEAKKYTTAKLRDINWLEKILDMRNSIRQIALETRHSEGFSSG